MENHNGVPVCESCGGQIAVRDYGEARCWPCRKAKLAATKERVSLVVPVDCPVCGARSKGWTAADASGKWIAGLHCEDSACDAVFDLRLTVHRDHTVTIEAKQIEEEE
jgi:hypothetical protein